MLGLTIQMPVGYTPDSMDQTIKLDHKDWPSWISGSQIVLASAKDNT